MEKSKEQKIIGVLTAKGRLTAKELADLLGSSRQYAQRLLKSLVKQGLLTQVGTTRGAYYVLSDPRGLVEPTIKSFNHKYNRTGLEEDKVVSAVEKALELTENTKENVREILKYALSEMINNAIDHSHGDFVNINTWMTADRLCFLVEDNGMGVFRSVMQTRTLENPFEAMQDLLKGKTTSNPERHSGEGIFFTSKAADRFALSSYGYEMIVDNQIDDVFFRQTEEPFSGTQVSFCIKQDSARTLMAIFNRFTSDDNLEFDTGEIKVRLYEPGYDYISRSQGRRLMASMNQFKYITLDFSGVDAIGQGFADEVFRVFQKAHPDITIAPEKMNEAVTFMVNRAKSGW